MMKSLLLSSLFVLFCCRGLTSVGGSEWEQGVSGNRTCMYDYSGLNHSFVPGRSSHGKPRHWRPRFHNCNRGQAGRCERSVPYRMKRPSRKLRGLQTSSDGYIRVLFPDGEAVDSAAIEVFNSAADFWNEAIAANTLFAFDLVLDAIAESEIQTNWGVACGIEPDEATFTLEVDPEADSQLVVLARIRGDDDFSDGVGGVLAAAGPCLQGLDTYSNTQTYIGVMTFDEDDFNSQLVGDSNLLLSTVKHELGHVIGVGTNWDLAGLIENSAIDNPANTPTYNGEYGIEGHLLIGESGNPRLEDDGGSGTADSHWEESVYDNELMTGFLGSGSSPASILTIKSLLDIGLIVNECAAENFRDFEKDSDNCVNFLNPNNEEDLNNGDVGDPFGVSSSNSDIDNRQLALITVGGFLVVGSASYLVYSYTRETCETRNTSARQQPNSHYLSPTTAKKDVSGETSTIQSNPRDVSDPNLRSQRRGNFSTLRVSKSQYAGPPEL